MSNSSSLLHAQSPLNHETVADAPFAVAIMARIATRGATRARDARDASVRAPCAPSPSSSTPTVDASPERHVVLLLSDFFLPSVGGVELHIYALATRLRARGHKVVILTHAHPGRVGVHWITGGIKVYHAPRVVMYDNCTFPNILGAMRLFRKVG